MATAPSPRSSPAPPPPPPPLPQKHSGSGAAAAAAVVGSPTAPGASRLSFDDVAKHFNVPIAEAATALGVCSSALKRICRENGVVRWPYRKFLAGKTVDDIKKDAAREKGKEFVELSKVARERLDQPSNTYLGFALPGSTLVTSQTHEASKLQRGFSLPGQVPQQQGSKLFPEGYSMFQPVHGIPNYVDEFKYGFPADGLSLATPEWWGGCSGTGSILQAELPPEGEKPQSNESSPSAPDKAREPGKDSQPVSLLCSMRKQAVTDGETSIKHGVSGGYGHYKLGKRERSILIQVFQSSLPQQWKDYVS